MRRALFWTAAGLGVAMVATGVTVGALGYTRTSGPDGAVRGYFAALSRGDAPGALAYGDLPAGPHTLLTDTVLHEQQRLAPLRHVTVVRTREHGRTATVSVRYRLGFADRDTAVTADVGVHRSGRNWRLDRVAVPTELEATTAVQRESIAGAGVPVGRTLLFPGALPIRFDTPYLRLDPEHATVGFDTAPLTEVDVDVTAAGRRAMAATVRSRLETCLSGPDDPSCPVPDQRSVPGSVRGRMVGALHSPDVRLQPSDALGRLEFSATASVAATYRRLDFHNRPQAASGTVTLHLFATAYAVASLRPVWTAG